MKAISKALKGYKAKKRSGEKAYKRSESIAKFKKTGTFKTKAGGSGHVAGEEWANKKGIDPDSIARRYSKNSPSFDEGVYKYKQEAKKKALQKEIMSRWS